MIWYDVKTKLPTDGARCLALCRVVFDSFSSWEGILDLHFTHEYGWDRNDHENTRFKVIIWCDFPQIPRVG